MSNRLKDKVAIITGAAKGIGFATAQRFAQEGAKVIITDVNLTSVNEAVAQTPNAEGYAMNVTDRATIQSVVDQVIQKHGRIDILINNAGKESLGWDLTEVLSPLNVNEQGKAQAFDDIEELVRAVAQEAKPGDHILVMSNGGFGGVHQKIMNAISVK